MFRAVWIEFSWTKTFWFENIHKKLILFMKSQNKSDNKWAHIRSPYYGMQTFAEIVIEQYESSSSIICLHFAKFVRQKF